MNNKFHIQKEGFLMRVKRTSCKNRILAGLLSVVMLIGMLPMSVFAADVDTDYLFFASDRHANESIIDTMINNMEAKIGENKLEYLGLCGDMVGSGNTHPSYKSSTVLAEVTGATTSLSAANVDIVAGVHDTNVTDDAGIVLPYSGGGAQIYVGDKYYIYGVPESCISGESSSVDPETEAKDFVDWANGANIDKSKVVIVMSHYPLHQRRGDNDYAYLWADALNKVAVGDDTTVDRDVVFFWGHNHTGEEVADTNVYFKAPGSSISVQGGSSSQTIYFSYANAGYLNAKSSATLLSITDDAITFNKYVNSSVSTTNTVNRVKQAAELTSISVSGDQSYTVGDALNLKVMANYSNNTAVDVTDEATFSGYDMTTPGTYTVQASYEGFTATAVITVSYPTFTEWDDFDCVSVKVTAPGITGLNVAYAWGEPDLSETFYDYMSVDVEVEGHTADTEINYVMEVFSEISTDGLVLYHVADDGTLTPIDYELTTSQSGGSYMNFTTSLTGIFAHGQLNIPEGYVLSGIEVSNVVNTDYFVGDSLDMVNPVVTATYSKEGCEDFIRILSIKDDYATEDGYIVYGYDMTVAGEQVVTVSYTDDGENCTASFVIHVWEKEFSNADNVIIDMGEEDFGVTAVHVAQSTNKNVASAVEEVIVGNNYVAYDITLEFAEGYGQSDSIKTVTLPIPEGVNNPVVFYVSDNGKTVTNMKATKTTGGKSVVFTTTHFSTYVVGESIEIEVPAAQTATGSGTATTTEKKTVYVRTSSLTSGKSYLIVNGNSAGDYYALANNDGRVAATSVKVESGTLSGLNGTQTYIELNDATDELWTVSGTTSISMKNGDYYVGYTGWNTNRTFGLSGTERTWTYNSESNQVSIKPGSSTYYLRYSNSSWGWTTSPSKVYFYASTEIETTTTTTVTGTYSIAGEELIRVIESGSGQTGTLSSTLTFQPASGTATTTENPAGATYAVYNDGSVNGDPNGIIEKIEGNVVTFTGKYGKAVVKVSYTTEFGVVDNYIQVTVTKPTYELQITNGSTNEVINDTIVIKGQNAIDAGYSLWAQVTRTGENSSETSSAEADKLTWSSSNTSIATVDESGNVTFKGKEGVVEITAYYMRPDGVQEVDTVKISVSKSTHTTPEDGTNDFPEYPAQGSIRFDKTASAVGNYSETGLALVELSMTGVPYSTGSAIDVLLMLDMSTSMDAVVGEDEKGNDIDRVDVTIEAAKAFAKTIVQNKDGSYNNNKIAIKYFNGSKVYTTTDYISVSNDTELEALNDKIEALYTPTSSGTYYSVAMENAYNSIIAQDAVSDHTQALVFMSDGGPTYYTYLNDSGTGTVVNHSNGTTFVNWFDIDNKGTNDETDDTATPNSGFKTEYYSYELKRAGYPVYTVGLGLETNSKGPSSYTSLTSGAHASLTGQILSRMATSGSYFYNIADNDAVANMGNIFAGIAASIKEAATDVVVEDKVGEKYSINFSLPGYNTTNALDTAALDGQSEFYLQVVDYTLDATTHQRVGEPKVLEKFAFNLNGSLKSHTVNGAACGDSTCSHVTVTNGAITALDGTYFDYLSNASGEYLTWTAEKISSTELALQYFAHLDNSSGVAVGEQVPAGTYYTNEYATLSYTNFNGTKCQQEFPVPQLTWYGAQVSYVFYLVNEAGEPVNRAGREIPFAEAIYVTDVHTQAVIWNDLEQTASLEASILADDMLNGVYELYDDGASYNIHVYADEEGSNLNNHFVISGLIGPNDTRRNPNTTYVFNTKAGANKYNAHGAYAADESYLCKGEGIISDVDYDEATVTGETDFVNGVYYTLEDGKYTRALTYTSGAVYYTLTAATYTPAANETQWKPGEDDRYTGGTMIGEYVYYVDEDGQVYTIVQKSDATKVHSGFDFANTTVAFAVVWKPELKEDVVVVDFGLDVVIDVYANDAMAAGVVGVRLSAPTDANGYVIDKNYGTYDGKNYRSSVTSEDGIWTASVENLTSVRFHMNEMGISAPATFYYEAEVNYYDDGDLQTKTMYSSVTVIPATSIYYEESFIDFATLKSDGTKLDDKDNKWATVGEVQDKTQDVDRPGVNNAMSDLWDADNVYGYDSAYAECEEYSMGSAAMIEVNANIRGEAQFTFAGTGFDIIGLTDKTTGTLIVQVIDANGNTIKSSVVDTYYGYTFDQDSGQWVVVNNADPNAIYQVPVMKIFGLDYGKYTVKLIAGYNKFFDHTPNDEKYTLYVDGVRVYDPCGLNSDANNAHKQDGEGWPTYFELRNVLLTADSFELTTDIEGAVFIDGNAKVGDKQISDYENFGPNNEVYLDKNQGVAFMLDIPAGAEVDKVQIGVKSADGSKVKLSAYNVSTITGKTINNTARNINTTTDMYYDITALKDHIIVIENSGNSGILSVTNVKITYKSDPNATSGASEEEQEQSGYTLARMYMSLAAAEQMLDAVNVDIEDETDLTPIISSGSDSQSGQGIVLPTQQSPSQAEKTEKPVKPSKNNADKNNSDRTNNVRVDGWFF